MCGEAGQRAQAVRDAQEGLQMTLALALDAGVVMLRVHNGSRHILLDLVDEVEPSGREQLLPAWDHAHFPLHGLAGAVFGFHHSIALGDALH